MTIALIGLVVAVVVLLLVDLFLFARGREPTFREGAIWSVGWLVLSLSVALVVLAFDNSDAALEYTTVYLIERSLSLDNLFVFLLLFAYFRIPTEHRAKLLFYGIVLALILRGVAILAGIALIEQFDFVVYILGATLLLLAYRILRQEEEPDPGNSRVLRAVQKVMPVDWDERGGELTVQKEGKRFATPLFLALIAVASADVAFAIDSIPAAFAITRDELLIWMGNAFALLGLRALFVLVEGLVARFRYLDETIAILLGLVGVKLLIEDVYKVGPILSLIIVFATLVLGIVLSLLADRRDRARGIEPERDSKLTSSSSDSPPSADGKTGEGAAETDSDRSPA